MLAGTRRSKRIDGRPRWHGKTIRARVLGCACRRACGQRTLPSPKSSTQFSPHCSLEPPSSSRSAHCRHKCTVGLSNSGHRDRSLSERRSLRLADDGIKKSGLCSQHAVAPEAKSSTHGLPHGSQNQPLQPSICKHSWMLLHIRDKPVSIKSQVPAQLMVSARVHALKNDLLGYPTEP